MPDVKQQVEALGADTIGATPGDMARRVKAETEQWARLVIRAKISFE